MTASITDIQAALKSAIEAANDVESFGLDVVVTVADSQVTTPPSPNDDEPMQLQVGFVGAATLARATSRVLDQTLIDINLKYRHPDGTQANLDQCHLVAEQMRDFLAEFTMTGARVEQVITPGPFDQIQAVQGTYSYRIGLDLDVIRSRHVRSAPTVTDSPRLTAIRNAVWDSIDHWSPFAEDEEEEIPPAWLRKFQSPADVEELTLHDPGLADLPAIAVTWGNIGQNWWTHREQKWPASLNVVYWLPADQIEIAEWRAQQIVECLYRATAEPGGLTYLRAATGYPPEKYSQTIEPVVLGRGQNKAIRGTVAFQLPATFKPYD